MQPYRWVWRDPEPKPENRRVFLALAAGLFVVPSVWIMLADGVNSNLLPRMALFSMGSALFMTAIAVGRWRREDREPRNRAN